MSRAILISETGPPGVLRLSELPTPEPAAGEILIRNHTGAVNLVDTIMSSTALVTGADQGPGNALVGSLASRALALCDTRLPHRLVHLQTTRLLLAVALMGVLLLPPAMTAADARFGRLSQPGIVAVVRHAHAPGTGEIPQRSRSTTAPHSAISALGAGNKHARSGRRSAPRARPSTGSSRANGAAAATRPASSTWLRSRICPRSTRSSGIRPALAGRPPSCGGSFSACRRQRP